MKIAFMGTPAFALPSLQRLEAEGHTICGVFTQPDRPRSRGMKPSYPPVKAYALSRGWPVFQPERFRDESALETLRGLAPELAVVAAYGQLLPEAALAVPPRGCVNVHASLLPRYRGAAPINWAIMRGERETGVTIMHMAKRLDAGDIICTRRTEIGAAEDAVSLAGRLSELGADALAEAVRALEEGTAARTPQDDALATWAPMLTRALSPLDWTKSSIELDCQVRGLAPWPGASTALDGKTVKIIHAAPGGASADPPGTLRAGREGIEAACGDGRLLLLTELQPEGGKRMSAAAYLNGRRLRAGDRL